MLQLVDPFSFFIIFVVYYIFHYILYFNRSIKYVHNRYIKKFSIIFFILKTHFPAGAMDPVSFFFTVFLKLYCNRSINVNYRIIITFSIFFFLFKIYFPAGAGPLYIFLILNNIFSHFILIYLKIPWSPSFFLY